jgi:hypothetical protein
LKEIKHAHTHKRERHCSALQHSSCCALLDLLSASIGSSVTLTLALSTPLVVDRCRFEWKFRELARAWFEKGHKRKSAYQ